MHRRSRLSVPAPSECLHSGVPGCLISVRERSVLVISVSQRPHPRCPDRRCGGLKNTPDDDSVRPRRRRNRCRLERRRDPLELVGVRGRSPSPILLRFALHRRCRRILAFDPVPRPAGAVGRAEALRYDAFEPELARVANLGRRCVGFTRLTDALLAARAVLQPASLAGRAVARLGFWKRAYARLWTLAAAQVLVKCRRQLTL
jgi:hypothetical protein